MGNRSLLGVHQSIGVAFDKSGTGLAVAPGHKTGREQDGFG